MKFDMTSDVIVGFKFAIIILIFVYNWWCIRLPHKFTEINDLATIYDCNKRQGALILKLKKLVDQIYLIYI